MFRWLTRYNKPESASAPTVLDDRTGAQVVDTGDLDIPAAGSIERYELMRKHPAIALACATATAPIKGSKPSFTVNEPATDDHLSLVQDNIKPMWSDLVRNMCTGIYYGCKPFEKVWDRNEKNQLIYRKVKPLSLKKTQLRLEKDGTFAGAKQDDVTLDEQYVFWYTHDKEDDNFFGRPRLANCEDPWLRWIDIAASEKQYVKLVACPTPRLQYPKGKGKDASGVEKTNFELAKELVAQVSKGRPVVMPNTVLSYAQALIDQGLDPSKFKAWVWDFIESSGQHGQDFVGMLRHKESLMFRGMLVPERVATEGQHGTKAEAGEHANVALANMQEALDEIIKHINWYLIDPLMVYNFGDQFAGSIVVEVDQLVDEELSILRRVMEKILSSKVSIFQKWVDVDAAMDRLGLPKAEEIIDSDRDEDEDTPEGEEDSEEEDDNLDPTEEIAKELSRLWHSSAA